LLLSYCSPKLIRKAVTARLMKAKRKTSNAKNTKYAIKRHAYKQSNESMYIVCICAYASSTEKSKKPNLLVWCPRAQASLLENAEWAKRFEFQSIIIKHSSQAALGGGG
jgi:hypothetical protein